MASERKFIAENIRRVLLKEYFIKETQMAGFGGIDIQRTPMGTRITLTVERPGMVIGRKGAKIKELTRTVSDVYGFDNPQIEVQECRDSSSNPQIMAQKLAHSLERGWHFRRAGHSTIRRVQDTEVKGCQVKLSGKLTGQRHRTEKFKWGNIKFCGEPALTTMDRGYAIAKKKLGLIGVSVDIMKKDAVLPDDVFIKHIPELKKLKEEPSLEPETEKKPTSEAEEKEEEKKAEPAEEKEKEEAEPDTKVEKKSSKKAESPKGSGKEEEKEKKPEPKKPETKKSTGKKSEKKKSDEKPESENDQEKPSEKPAKEESKDKASSKESDEKKKEEKGGEE